MAAYSTSVVIVNKTEEIGGESGLVSDASVVALGGRVEGGGHVADGWRLNVGRISIPYMAHG